jgi:hypothetical protein
MKPLTDLHYAYIICAVCVPFIYLALIVQGSPPHSKVGLCNATALYKFQLCVSSLDLIVLIICSEKNKLLSSSLCSFPFSCLCKHLTIHDWTRLCLATTEECFDPPFLLVLWFILVWLKNITKAISDTWLSLQREKSWTFRMNARVITTIPWFSVHFGDNELTSYASKLGHSS